MKEIGAFEAKNRLGQLLDLVEQGEEVIITRHGKPVALLVPPKTGFSRSEAREAARRIREMSQGCQARGASHQGFDKRRPKVSLVLDPSVALS
jgi:prevent-host-death family protein